MSPWWKRKSRSGGEKSTKVKEKPKAKSFDEVAEVRREGNSSALDGTGGTGLFPNKSDVERRIYHPLPRPAAIMASESMPHENGSAGASVSVSSVSSSGSSEETTDPGMYRYSDPANTPRGRSLMPRSLSPRQHGAEEKYLYSYSPVHEHERPSSIPVSPRRDVQLQRFDNLTNGNAFAHQGPSNETIYSPGSRSPRPRPRGYTISTSPVNSRVFNTGTESPLGKQDDLRSTSYPMPLPLPPGSPTSPAWRSLQSKWKKGKLLGRGTFGHVYAGFNSESGKMCAIKEVEVISDDSNSKESLKQLAQEINLLSQLSHPNIVHYHGSELIGDTLSVYLEYVSGGSIHKLLQDYGPLGEPVIQSYAGQILSGLAYLHGRNTIHRDIKGANILVDPNGEIKLADFGMAKHISSYTSIRSFKGSPYWMAPEVIMNSSGYSLSVDIWSLGCTIIEMATARPPWNQFTGVQAIFKIGNSKDIPEIPDHLSNEGKSFLKLCLQRDPSARPTALQLLDHPFVGNKAKIKISNANVVRDVFPSSSDGSHSPTAKDSSYNRSISPMSNKDYLRHAVGYSAISKTPSDLTCLKMNMSLPVSPCSSPLRQARQSNWSRLPSPPHPTYSSGAANYGIISNPRRPQGHSSRFTDQWPETVNGPIMHNFPRR